MMLSQQPVAAVLQDYKPTEKRQAIMDRPKAGRVRSTGSVADDASAAAAMILQSFMGLRFDQIGDLREDNLRGNITATYGTAS